MQSITIREMRNNLGKLDELLDKAQELVITRNGKPIARILPTKPKKPFPTNKELWALQTPSAVSSSQLIREDRDAR